jgi:transitional endoplasmic reticulum ATPase
MSRRELMKEVSELREQCDRTAVNVDVQHTGSQVILPEGMSFDEGIEWLYRKKDEEMTEVAINHTIECHPLDGAYALLRAIKEQYGWSQLVPTPGFFGSEPPTMVTMQISPTDSIQVPWGRMQIPGIHGYIATQFDGRKGIPNFQIVGTVLQKDRDQVHALAKRAERIVNDSSVYHGKALSLSLGYEREGRGFDPSVDGFKFLNLGGVMNQNLIFDKMTEHILDNTLFAFIENAERCRENGIPLKRGILLEGQYGVGKTLTAYITAKKAVDNGWTFILVEDARDLKQVLHMAKRYEPVVLFCEDIDRVTTGPRSISIDEILNTLDGIKSKEGETVVVFTTNHVENINKALLRPGRLDSVITLGPPDEEAVLRLVKHYGAKRIRPDQDISSVGPALKGQIPAVIREVVERSKVSAIVRGNGNGKDEFVEPEDLTIAAESMKRHLDLLKEDIKEPSDIEKFGEVVGTHLATSISEAVATITE